MGMTERIYSVVAAVLHANSATDVLIARLAHELAQVDPSFSAIKFCADAYCGV